MTAASDMRRHATTAQTELAGDTGIQAAKVGQIVDSADAGRFAPRHGGDTWLPDGLALPVPLSTVPLVEWRRYG